MRLPLPDGQWAELKDGITHGEDKALKKAYRAGREDVDAGVEFDTVIARAFVLSWAMKDRDGNPIPLEDVDAFDRAPADPVDAIVRAALETWTGVTLPNPLTPPSSDGSPSDSR